MTEVYDYTSAPWRRGILDVSRSTKSKAVSGEKGSPRQDESGSIKMEIGDYFRMLNSRLDEQDKRSKERDSRFEAYKRTSGTQISASKNCSFGYRGHV